MKSLDGGKKVAKNDTVENAKPENIDFSNVKIEP